jgi:hypothetical protein
MINFRASLEFAPFLAIPGSFAKLFYHVDKYFSLMPEWTLLYE